MKKATLLTLLAIACAACSSRTTASSILYQKQTVLGTPVNVVYVNLNDRNVKVTVAISKRGRGSSESVYSMVSRTRPAVAVTGTFFDPRTCIPTGDIVVAGKRLHSGYCGTSLCLTDDNRACVVSRKNRTALSDSTYETILQAGPTLIADGKIRLNLREEGFHDKRLSATTRKAAAGLTASNKLVLISANKPVSLRRLAMILQNLGVTQAVLLDGGSSTAMYVHGRFVSRPARQLTNLLLVYETPESYRSAGVQLAPTLLTPDYFRPSTTATATVEVGILHQEPIALAEGAIQPSPQLLSPWNSGDAVPLAPLNLEPQPAVIRRPDER